MCSYYGCRVHSRYSPFWMASISASVGCANSRHNTLVKAPRERNSSRSRRRRHSSKCQHVLCETSYSWRRNSDIGRARPRGRGRQHGESSADGESATACRRPNTNRTSSESPAMFVAVASVYTSHSNWRTSSGASREAVSRGRRRWRPARHRPRSFLSAVVGKHDHRSFFCLTSASRAALQTVNACSTTTDTRYAASSPISSPAASPMPFRGIFSSLRKCHADDGSAAPATACKGA